MKNSTDNGKKGEQLAVDFLESNGYRIVDRNYRYKRLEVDIIAITDDFLVFVEVKLRKNNHYGYPESFVDDKKVNRLHEAAEFFIETNAFSDKRSLRFDIISITLKPTLDIFHLKDAF